MRSIRFFSAILLAGAIQVAAGCAAWQADRWDLSQLRDPRASELDNRLTQRRSAVVNPFGGTDEEASEPTNSTLR